jgi:hypothetical protein
MWSSFKQILPRSIWPSQVAHRTLCKIYGKAEVLGGPFAGMKYISEAQGSVLIPKLLGIYEMELGSEIQRLAEMDFRSIYVIGAGEGYYAVGMAIKNPRAAVTAFEANESAHHLITEVAARNGVAERISIRGICLDADMQGIPEKSLVIMDVEGAEEHLLDPMKFCGLQNCTILFEAHFSPSETRTKILQKFEMSHGIQRFDSRGRVWSDIRCLPLLLLFYIRRNIGFWLDEMRGAQMQWYLMTPKAAGFQK